MSDKLNEARSNMISAWNDSQAGANIQQIQQAIFRLQEATSILSKLHCEMLEKGCIITD